MTFDELSRSISAELATGSVGVPVSLRLHLSWPDGDVDLGTTLDAVLKLARATFGCDATSVATSDHATGAQRVALCRFEKGQSALVSLSRGCGADRLFELVVVGNLGIIRLEGGELLSALPAG